MMSRILHTVRYLKPVQIYGRLYRPRPRLLRAGEPTERPIPGPWTCGIARPDPRTAPQQFRFLNQERRIETWNDSGIPKLWLYNLHYFEHPTADLILDWCARNPTGQGNGWEPYPLALRIPNWIKWRLSGNPLEPAATESLAYQAAWLARTVEYHLQANHLFANAKALVFAGAFFEGGAAPEWLARGLAILKDQLPEQVLSDGGHFERSPMYHSLILEDLLDLVALGRAYPGLLPDFGETAARMLGWLSHLTHPDGRIAFFNDAVFGVAPDPASLSDYAARLGIAPQSRPLGESGYLRLENRRAIVLFDAAPIGPDYQPGHAHADTLSFELSVDGHRVLVNSGVSTYENCARRHAQRATAAHNAVCIDGQDSSEVWSAFRVARRARPTGVRTDRRTFAEAAHDGYTRLKDPLIHFRRLDLSDAELRITDTLNARRAHRAEIYFHLHPESDARIQLDPKLARAEESTEWLPEFNRSEPNRTIVGRWCGNCPVQFVTRIPL